MTFPTTLQSVIPEFDQIPTLHLTRRHGDYIDNIPPNDMSSHVMKGTDFYKRPFIALKLYPRELVEYVKIQRERNYQSCLSLVALSKSRYLPVDIARKVETYLDYGTIREIQNIPFSVEHTESDIDIDIDTDTSTDDIQSYHTYLRHTKRYRNVLEYVSNQASVHTIFQRYTDSDKYVHGENYHLSDSIYHWRLLKIDVCVLFGRGWNKNTSNDPEKTLTQLFQGTYPQSVLYDDTVAKTLHPPSYP